MPRSEIVGFGEGKRGVLGLSSSQTAEDGRRTDGAVVWGENNSEEPVQGSLEEVTGLHGGHDGGQSLLKVNIFEFADICSLSP